ncbi:MAG: O-antigen ligase family protein, partial [Rhodospirillaceae bacterium]|nr:O-antigen ligase family protein [Rhodospirillaceae bacterium]
SVHAVMLLLSCGLIFVLATQLGRRRHRAAQAVVAVAVSGAVYGAAALAFHALGVDYVLWLPKWAYLGDATGTFVGRTAFGAFAGIGALTGLVQALQGHVSRLPTIGPGARIERLLSRVIPWLFVSVFLLLAVLASHSRGALLVTLAACLVLIVAAAVGGLLRARHAVVWIVATGVIVGTVVLADGDVTVSRLWGEGDWSGDRPNLLRLTWAAISDAPFVGHGVGAFEQSFYPYRDLSLPRDVIYGHAHNAWAETIMALGWPAGGCLLMAIIAVVFVCAVGVIRRRQDQIYPAWAVSVAFLLGLQAVIDFTVQIPALAALLAYILGIGYAQSWSQRNANASDVSRDGGLGGERSSVPGD